MSEPKSEIAELVERAMALANAATPGRWEADIVASQDMWVIAKGTDGHIGICRVYQNAQKDQAQLTGNAAFIAASRQLIPELCEAITRLSQPSGEEIREACARVAYDYAEKMERSVLERTAFGRPHIVADSKADAARDIANTIRSLPLSSGSNKSDDLGTAAPRVTLPLLPPTSE